MAVIRQAVKRQQCERDCYQLPFVRMKTWQRLEDVEPGTPLGERLKQALLAEGRALKPTESELGMSAGHLGRIVRGERWSETVDVELAVRLAKLLHVNFEWLVTGDGPMRREGRGPTKAETAFVIARQLGTREDAIQIAWEQNKNRADELEVMEWLSIINNETSRLIRTRVPHPEVVQTVQQSVRRVGRQKRSLKEKQTQKLAEKARLEADAAKVLPLRVVNDKQ